MNGTMANMSYGAPPLHLVLGRARARARARGAASSPAEEVADECLHCLAAHRLLQPELQLAHRVVDEDGGRVGRGEAEELQEVRRPRRVSKDEAQPVAVPAARRRGMGLRGSHGTEE